MSSSGRKTDEKMPDWLKYYDLSRRTGIPEINQHFSRLQSGSSRCRDITEGSISLNKKARAVYGNEILRLIQISRATDRKDVLQWKSSQSKWQANTKKTQFSSRFFILIIELFILSTVFSVLLIENQKHWKTNGLGWLYWMICLRMH